MLKNRKDIAMSADLRGAERGGGSGFGTATQVRAWVVHPPTFRFSGGVSTWDHALAQGDVTIYEGDAYAIWGKARWKMNHDAIVPPTISAVDGVHSRTYIFPPRRHDTSTHTHI